jgi:hypothetical protein
MPLLPPTHQVIEHVLPHNFDASWIMPGLHFVREEDGGGVDYNYQRGTLVGFRYNQTAHTIGGDVRDQRVTVKVTWTF